jgi:hypothetical protein
MHRPLACIALLVLSASPAFAQANDVTYCQSLVDKYQKYVGYKGDKMAQVDMNIEAQLAIDKCSKGDPSGVPVLEKALRNGGFDLPKR